MRGEGGGVDTNLDVPPPIIIFHNYIHRLCSYIFICDIYRDTYRGRRGSLYPLSVTTTDLLSVRSFTALSAIHKECCVISVIRTEKWLIRYRY